MREFRKLDYLIFFVLSFLLFIIQIIGTPTVSIVLRVIIAASITAFVLGTITNLFSLILRKLESSKR